MISIKLLKSGLYSPKKNYVSSDFFNLHRFIEAYLKRLLLISLRLKSVRYKESTKIVENTYVNTKVLIEKVLFLLDQSGKKQADVIQELKLRHNDFFILSELFINFSSKYRNRLAHGTIDELKDIELINLLYYVNKSFFSEFEKLLQKEYGHSAFDKPSDWGALRGSIENIEDSAKRLHLGKILDAPLPVVTVRNKLAKTSFSIKV